MNERGEMNALEARRIQLAKLGEELGDTEDAWSGVFDQLEGPSSNEELNSKDFQDRLQERMAALLEKESALKQAISGVRNELAKEHQAALTEWERLDSQERLLLDEIVNNANRYTIEEYKIILDQIHDTDTRREQLSKQVNDVFEQLERAA